VNIEAAGGVCDEHTCKRQTQWLDDKQVISHLYIAMEPTYTPVMAYSLVHMEVSMGWMLEPYSPG